MTEKLIRITSNDKEVSQSVHNSNFIVYLKETYQTQNVKRILVKDILVPNVFYNVRDGKNGSLNNVLNFDEPGPGPLSITVPQGQYSTSTLIPVLETLMNLQLVSGTVAITQDSISGLLTFTFTGTTAFIDSTSPMAPVLGISTTGVASGVIVSDFPPALNGIQMVYVHSRDVADAHLIDADSGLISVVENVSFNNVPYGSYAHRQNSDDELALIDYTQPRNINKINIVLRDDLGNILDIGTKEMTVVLKAFF